MATMAMRTGQVVGDRSVVEERLAGQGEHERRSRHRFSLHLGVSCRSLKRGESSAGKVIDMSSRAVCFTTNARWHLGEMVEVSIDWPAPLFDGNALNLKVKGDVVRTGADRAAVSIMWHEFYVRKSHV